MNRGRYIVHRLALMIPVLFGITVVVFSLLQLIPGDPATTILGIQARPESVAALRHELGLDRPLWEQYLRYLRNVVTFDLGQSLKYKTSVGSLLPGRLEVTLALIAYATVLTIAISLPLGIVSALRRNGIFDQVTRAFLMVTLVMPAFWVGILFLTFFSIRLQLFPVAGYGDGWQEHLHHLFLPALTIALSIAPLIVRALRTSILEGLGSDYVRTARAKGLREQAVVTTHVLRNALIPAVTLLGLSV
ncbi:MAG: binding-protein-dependent transport system inner rane component, partial [Thermomicrobiales bacterium]|nr:binding-protein-dependent transport system inner rane component [Thermomicrobiales bacterium]